MILYCRKKDALFHHNCPGVEREYFIEFLHRFRFCAVITYNYLKERVGITAVSGYERKLLLKSLLQFLRFNAGCLLVVKEKPYPVTLALALSICLYIFLIRRPHLLRLVKSYASICRLAKHMKNCLAHK